MLTIEEIHEVELATLKEFHSFCESNNLKYSLAYGTLLGAIRHNGFIPWDNDVDVYMTRCDYEKMIELARDNSHYITDNLYVLHYSFDTNYKYNLLRVCNKKTKIIAPYLREQPEKMGAWIDVFVLDDELDITKHNFLFKGKVFWYSYLTQWDLYFDPKKMKRWKDYIILFFYLLFVRKSKNKPAQLLDQLALKSSNDKADNYEYYGYDTLKKKPKISKDNFNNSFLYQFEDTKLYVMKQAEQYLSEAYGDWRKLPPVEKRVGFNYQIEYTDADYNDDNK